MPTAVSPSLASELRLVIARLARRVRQQGGTGGLSPSQLSALSSIEQAGAIRLGDLAGRESVSAPTMSRIVASLEDHGLVVRTPDALDRRAAQLSLTAAGRTRLKRIRSERTALLQRRVDALDTDDRRRLVEALPVLAALLDDPDPDPDANPGPYSDDGATQAADEADS